MGRIITDYLFRKGLPSAVCTPFEVTAEETVTYTCEPFTATVDEIAPAIPMLMTFNTANTSVGSSTSTQLQLPLVSGFTYNFVVDWGDGSTDTITAWNQTETLHTYASSGTYQISITGTCEAWRFNNTGDRNKLISVDQWGDVGFASFGLFSAFYGCENATSYALTMPNYSVTTLDSCWRNNSSCTQFSNVNNLTSVTNIGNTWDGCSTATSFPDVDNLTSLTGAALARTWKDCSSATSFPEVNTLTSVTSLNNTWGGCSSATSFPDVDNLTSVDLINSTWEDCSSCVTFPSVNTLTLVTDMISCWKGCSSMVVAPLVSNLVNCTLFGAAWQDCTSLQTFAANQFDGITSLGVSSFTSSFTNTNLTELSIDNILVSLDTSGVTGGNFDQTGGNAPSNGTGEPAIDNLRAKGWSISVTGGY